MLDRRIWIALSLCALEGLLLVRSAQASHAYVMTCCNVPSSVSVIKRDTHKLAATLTVGRGAVVTAESRDGKTLYVANQNDSTISVLDRATGVVTATIALNSYVGSPYGLVISPDGSRLYVTATDGNGAAVDILGLDTADNMVLFDVQVPGSFWPNTPIPLPAPAISSDGQYLFAFTGGLIVFDVNTFASQSITVASDVSHPQGLAVTPDGAYAVITFNEGGPFTQNKGQFVMIDLSTQSVVKQISYPASVSVGPVVTSPDGSLAYFPANRSGDVAVESFDIKSQQIVDRFGSGSGTGIAIAITPDGAEIELGESDASVVSIDAASGAVLARTGTLGVLDSIAVSSDSQWIYVPNYDSSMVAVIDPLTSQITGQIPAGVIYTMYDTPYTLQVSADGRKVVVATLLNLTFIDAVTQRLIGAVPLNGSFVSVTMSPHAERAYAVMGAPSGGTPQIQVIDTKSLTVTGVVNLTTADQPSEAAVSPDGSTLYVGEKYCASGGSCVPQMLEIDTSTLAVTGQVVLSSSEFTPGGIVISRDGKTAYVEGLWFSGGISVVNLQQGQVVATIGAQNGGPAIALASNQQFIYEAAPTNYAYYVIDLATQQATGVPNGNSNGIAVSPDGRLVYLTNELGDSVASFSAYPNGVPVFLGTINLPSASDGVGFSIF